MLGQMTFGELLGEEYELPEMAAPKKEEKKAEKKTPAKKAAKKEEKLLNVTLPCKVYGQNFQTEIQPGEGETTITSNELIKRLIESGIDEAAVSTRAVFIPEDNASKAYLVEGNEVCPDDDTVIVFGENGITFSYGEKKATFTAADFDGKEEDEICVADVKAKIFGLFPAFAKSQTFYDIEAGVIVPFLSYAKKENDTTKVMYPITVSIAGEEVTLGGSEVKGETVKELVAYLTKDYATDGLTVELTKLQDGIFYAVFKARGNTAKNSEKKNKGAKTSKKTEKYPTEGTTIYLVFNGHRESVTAETFGGKDKITKNDVIEYFKPRFAVFSSAEKVGNINCNYDETCKVLSVDCTPGRRGGNASFFPDAGLPVLNDKEMSGYLFNAAATCYKRIGNICSQHNGEILYANMTSAYFISNEGQLLSYQRKQERVPEKVFKGMVGYFKSMLPNEAICRIVFNARTECYALQIPESSTVTRVTVEDAVFKMIPPYCEVVATFHSHNTMPAFFSSTDDLAESDQIGVFGVIGRLNEKPIDAKMRAMFQGSYLMLPVSYLFETGVSEVAA